MMAHGGRVKTGIDSAEKYAQVRSDHVTHRLFRRGEQLLLCRFPGLGHEVRLIDVEMSLS